MLHHKSNKFIYGFFLLLLIAIASWVEGHLRYIMENVKRIRNI
jgi:hypothetical protein